MENNLRNFALTERKSPYGNGARNEALQKAVTRALAYEQSFRDWQVTPSACALQRID